MSSNRKIFVFVAVPILIVFGVVAYVGLSGNRGTTNNSETSSSTATTDACPDLITPVDVSHVTAVLYPGQVRGDDYKPHGGFRMDNTSDNLVQVKAPLSARVIDGSRYIQAGELQYMFDFKTDCGLEYRLDHLKTLSSKLQAIADSLPAAKVDDSQTTDIRSKVTVTAGEVVATAVGFEKGDPGPNVTFDFGLYDKQHKNDASKDASWVASHQEDGDQAIYAVCWLDWLPAADAAILKALPGGDGVGGKTSDYCK